MREQSEEGRLGGHLAKGHSLTHSAATLAAGDQAGRITEVKILF